MIVLIATHNRHKLEEIRQIFALPSLKLVAADEVPGLPEDVVEDADTFEGNALKKARELCAASGLWTLADDSGLEVEALGNAPGVHSARYAARPHSAPRTTPSCFAIWRTRPTAGRASAARLRCVRRTGGSGRSKDAARARSSQRHAARTASVTTRSLCRTASRKRLPNSTAPPRTPSRTAGGHSAPQRRPGGAG